MKGVPSWIGKSQATRSEPFRAEVTHAVDGSYALSTENDGSIPLQARTAYSVQLRGSIVYLTQSTVTIQSDLVSAETESETLAIANEVKLYV